MEHCRARPRSAGYGDGAAALTGMAKGAGSARPATSSSTVRTRTTGTAWDAAQPAPSFHHALMRLLPQEFSRSNNLSSAIPTIQPIAQRPNSRDCHCGTRKHKNYRKDWRNNINNNSKNQEDSCPTSTTSARSCPQTKLELSAHEFTVQPDVVIERAPQFKSSTLYFEVKLTELLSKKKFRQSSDQLVQPDVYRVRVCWEVFGELCKARTPFAGVLSTIYNQLGKSIYSNFIAPRSCEGIDFENMPYFELAERLQTMINNFEEQREHWKLAITDRQSDLSRMQENLEDLRSQVKASESASSNLEIKLARTSQSLEEIVSQVSILQEEIKRLKKKLKVARADQLRAGQLQYERELRKERYEKLKESYDGMSQEMQEVLYCLETVRRELADSVPKEEMEKANGRIAELEKELAEAEALVATQEALSEQLTPRPDWRALRPYRSQDPKPSTAEQVAEVCRQNMALIENVGRLQLDCTSAEAVLCETIRPKSRVRMASTSNRKASNISGTGGDNAKTKASGIGKQLLQNKLKTSVVTITTPETKNTSAKFKKNKGR